MIELPVAVLEGGIPLCVECVRLSSRLQDAEDTLATLEAIVSWRNPPTSWLGGRTAWHMLPRPLASEGLAPNVAALKLKGIGAAPSEGTHAIPPADQTYYRHPDERDHPHLGFTPKGKLAIVESKPTPRGGILLACAENEFDLAEHLLAHKIPAVVPIAVHRYENLRYTPPNGEPQSMGAVVTGSPDREPYRLSAVVGLRDWESDSSCAMYVWAVATRFGIKPDPCEWGRQRLYLISELYRSYGLLLRRFSEVRCFRYSSHCDNIAYSLELGTTIMVDLDTSAMLDDLPAHQVSLQVVRDVMSALFHLGCDLVRPEHVLPGTGASLRSQDPFLAFLQGYFHDIQVPSMITAPYREEVACVCDRVERYRDAIVGDHLYGRDLYRRIRLDTELVFAALFRIGFTLYELSSLSERWQTPYDLIGLDRHIADYLADSSARRLARLISHEPRSENGPALVVDR